MNWLVPPGISSGHNSRRKSPSWAVLIYGCRCPEPIEEGPPFADVADQLIRRPFAWKLKVCAVARACRVPEATIAPAPVERQAGQPGQSMVSASCRSPMRSSEALAWSALRRDAGTAQHAVVRACIWQVGVVACGRLSALSKQSWLMHSAQMGHSPELQALGQ